MREHMILKPHIIRHNSIYKYKIIKTRTDMGEAKLNEFGRRGYELTSVITDEYGYTYYFKIAVDNNG